MSITNYVETRYVGEKGKTTAVWQCETLICSDLKGALSGIHSRPSDTDIIDMAAQLVDLVSHFEDEPGYIDFDLIVGESNEVEIPVRVELDLTPAPLALISLTPCEVGKVSHVA